eukprot:14721410-Alexandrium_andersonii.AAC.1
MHDHAVRRHSDVCASAGCARAQTRQLRTSAGTRCAIVRHTQAHATRAGTVLSECWHKRARLARQGVCVEAQSKYARGTL